MHIVLVQERYSEDGEIAGIFHWKPGRCLCSTQLSCWTRGAICTTCTWRNVNQTSTEPKIIATCLHAVAANYYGDASPVHDTVCSYHLQGNAFPFQWTFSLGR